jgi:diguanylate cyclase (GGDEF)-like protein
MSAAFWSIGGKIQLLAGSAFLLGLAGVLGFQTYARIEATRQERLDANLRIVHGLSGTASGAIASRNDSVIKSYMELLKSDPRAAGIVVSAGNRVIESQQSIDHFELPIENLSALALKVEASRMPEVERSGDYEFIAVPVEGRAARTIGSIAVAWSTKGLLDNVWQAAVREAFALVGVLALVLVVLVASLRRFVTLPLKIIAARLEAMPALGGDANQPAAAKFEHRQDEIGTFARALDRFYRDAAEKHRLHGQLAHLAGHDALTGLPNRRRFQECLDAALGDKHGDDHIALLFLDLDRFKIVNDTLGHAAGDQLLKTVAQRLLDCIREQDIVCRLGGDEFAILQLDAPQPEGAEALALRITQSLSAPVAIGDHQAKIGVSTGIAVAPRDGEDAATLLKNADLAVYAAKTQGRNIHRFYTSELSAGERQRRKLEVELRTALEAGQFELHYQPIVNLESGQVSSFEALLRWRHPRLGMVPPGEFIPIAEEIGLIVAIGDWVIGEASREAAKWPAAVRVAVNISAVQFQRGDLAQTVFAALGRSQLAAGRLELEITESALLGDDNATIELLHRLRGMGVRITMDDFGIGYSSLSYLGKFPFDKIKIDGTFVRDLSGCKASAAIIDAVAGMSRGLGVETVAEGVETEDQRRQLAAAGITEMQGFLFSPPRPAQEIERRFFGGRRRADRQASA